MDLRSDFIPVVFSAPNIVGVTGAAWGGGVFAFTGDDCVTTALSRCSAALLICGTSLLPGRAIRSSSSTISTTSSGSEAFPPSGSSATGGALEEENCKGSRYVPESISLKLLRCLVILGSRFSSCKMSSMHLFISFFSTGSSEISNKRSSLLNNFSRSL